MESHKERTARYTQEALAQTPGRDWEEKCFTLARQLAWVRDKLERGEALAEGSDPWRAAHYRTLFHALAPDHPLLRKMEKDMEPTGKKSDDGKPPIALVPSALIHGAARVLAHGAEKYGPHNWRGGIKYSRIYSALLRHLLAWNDGEDQDPVDKGGSGLNHLCHAACELAFLMQFVADGRKDLDDRYKETPSAQAKNE